jgi:Glutamate-cysteine ligase family 2(GCS2)
VMNRARTYLPHILALTTNSPLWQGRPTGYQSFRTMVWAPFPVANVPDAYPTLQAYRDFHDLLEVAGALRPPRRVWWDLRLHDALPTLEFRIADMPANHADMMAVVAFIQALCKTLLDQLDLDGETPVVPTPVIAENKWRAARYGLRGTCIDHDRRREVALRDAIAEVLNRCAPAFEALGTTEYLARLHWMLDPAYRTGAERQLAAYSLRSDPREVVSMLVTLPMSKDKGLLGFANETELLAGCPPGLAGVLTDGQHTWSTTLDTANVLPAGGLSSGTPRTFDWEGALGQSPPDTGSAPVRLQAVSHLEANTASGIDQSSPAGDPAFIPMPEGRGPQPEVRVAA